MAKRKASGKPEKQERQRKPKKAPATPKHWQVAEEGEPVPEESPVHLAKCPECPAGVKYRLSATGASLIVVERYGVDIETGFGIGPDSRPLCPNGHGEMVLQDEQIPVGEAMQQVAEKVNGEATQLALIDTSKPFNYEDVWRDVAAKQAEVTALERIHSEDAARAKESKKNLEAAQSVLSRMISVYEERRRQKERDAENRQADADSVESFVARLRAIGIDWDVASARALSTDEIDAAGAWLADAEAHPDERERWDAARPACLPQVEHEDVEEPIESGERAGSEASL